MLLPVLCIPLLCKVPGNFEMSPGWVNAHSGFPSTKPLESAAARLVQQAVFVFPALKAESYQGEAACPCHDFRVIQFGWG